MDFTSVTPVILGMLRWGPRSGYDIKRIVDNSTRFFWAASYGQIYPDLRRLAGAGLIEQMGKPKGGRRRTLYRLTPAGEDALREWLLSPSLSVELRDEGFLKLFLSEALTDEEALGLLGALRSRHEAVVARLSEIEARAKERGGLPYGVLRWGLGVNRLTAELCAELERELLDEREEEGVPDVRPAG